MITVIHFCQLDVGLFDAQVIGHGQFFDTFTKVFFKILLWNAADVRIAGIHGYVLEVVETTENAEFTNLGDTGKEAKLDAGILGFHYAIETLKKAAERFIQLLVTQRVHNRFVVFINENDNA